MGAVGRRREMLCHGEGPLYVCGDVWMEGRDGCICMHTAAERTGECSGAVGREWEEGGV